MGASAGDFLNVASTSDIAALDDGQSQPTHLLEKDGSVMASGEVTRISTNEYRLNIAGSADRAVAWLRALSDGYALFDDQDIHAKLPGPVAVKVNRRGRTDRAGARRWLRPEGLPHRHQWREL